MIYAPRVAVEAELHALRRAAADRDVEIDFFGNIGLRFLEEAVEHAKVLHRLGLDFGRRARLEGRSAGNQQCELKHGGS